MAHNHFHHNVLSAIPRPRRVSIIDEKSELRELGGGRFQFPEHIEFTIAIDGMHKRRFRPKKSYHSDTMTPTEIIAMGKNKRKIRRTPARKVKKQANSENLCPPP